MPELKPLLREAIPAALEKARHYRLLNEPLQAERICLAILAVDTDHEEALVIQLLSLTVQFPNRKGIAVREARELLPRFADEYRRVYYEGIIWERRAQAKYDLGGPGSSHQAHERLHRALECYERAIELRPEGNEDATLRWNTCVRILARHPDLKPAPEDDFHPFLE